MKDPYKVLGMSKNSDAQSLRNRYEELKARYSEQRFQEGEAGNEGARLLNELEESWKLISRDLENERYASGGYEEVEDCIKRGDYDRAQNVLDSITERNGKWHYFQSIIFYKREWLSESRAQLVLAIQLEPDNAKYKESLRKIDMVMGNSGVNAQDMGRTQYGPYQNAQQQQQQQLYQQQQTDTTANTCANCMCAYCLTEMCCAMARGCH